MVRGRAILPALLCCGAACGHTRPGTALTTPPATDSLQALAPTAEPLVEWLVASAIPLASTDPNAPIDELARLDPFFAQRRTVGLGESTHGTREFVHLKHRVFRYLVERHGFTTLAMEMMHEPAVAVDAYVRGGQGRARDLVRGSFFFFDAEEMIALIEWMRNHNQARPPHEHVHFFGFDVQGSDRSARALRSYLPRVDPTAASRFDTLLARRGDRSFVPTEESLAMDEALRAAFTETEEEYVRLTGRDAYEAALQSVFVLSAASDTQGKCGDRQGCRSVMRDGYMAENVKRRQERTGERLMVWGHNGHVGHSEAADGWRSMGSYLRESMGREYAAVALEFNRGGFVASAGGSLPTRRKHVLAHLGHREVAEYVAPPVEEPALPYWLARTAMPQFFVPLSEAPAPIRALLRNRSRLHSFGGNPAEPNSYDEYGPVYEVFDAILFVDETHGYSFPGD